MYMYTLYVDGIGCHGNFSCDSPKTSLCAGGTHLTVFAHSLATHLNIGLTSKDLEKVSTQIYEETNKWLLSLFKYVNVYLIVFVVVK